MDLTRISELAQTGKYMTVSGFVMLIYDYLLTSGLEVELIWKSRWTIMKILYFLSRYSAFIDLPLVVFRNVAPEISDQLRLCYIIFCITCAAPMIGYGAAELILIWRTYALWGNSRRVLIFLLVMFSAVYSGNIICLGIYLQSVQFGLPPPGVTECWISKASTIIFVAFALVVIAETIIMSLTLWIGFKRYRHSHNQLIRTLYRDGILSYIYMFLISIVNIIISVTGPQEFVDAMNEFQRALQSVLSTRIILHVRQAALAESTSGTSDTVVSELRIRPPASHLSLDN